MSPTLKKFFYHLFLVVLGPRGCLRTSSRCSQWGLLSSYGAPGSDFSGPSCTAAWTVSLRGISESSQIRDLTHLYCISRWILNWTTQSLSHICNDILFNGSFHQQHSDRRSICFIVKIWSTLSPPPANSLFYQLPFA